MNAAASTSRPRLESLLRYLDRDPENLSLIADAAAAAYGEHAYDKTAELLTRYAQKQPLTPHLVNLGGMVALAQGRFADAVLAFETLRRDGNDNPAARFNLAWAHAMTEAHEEALQLLDDDAVAVSPRAPRLKIEMFHHLGRYEEGLEAGHALAQRYPHNDALMGALATLAMDAGKADLALAYAQRGAAAPESQTVLGLMALSANDSGGAMALFDNAIAAQPKNPRALIGRGLALLASGKNAEGAKALDEGARIFGDHLGSWVAAGWAHFVGGDYQRARQRFDRVVALDGNFAEGHGGLAVLDVLEGKLDDARRRADIALRLDRNSLGGALAMSMLQDKAGHPATAKKIRDAAMALAVGPNGQSLAQALAAHAGAGTRGGSGRSKL